MVSNKNGYIKEAEVWELLQDARMILMSNKDIDSLIFCFSGHGSTDCILTSDYNGNKLGKIPITAIQQWFGDTNVRPYFLKSPKLIILDCCRGNTRTRTIKHKIKIQQNKGDKIVYKRHPVQDYAVLFSNANGYESSNADDGSGGFLITAVDKILSIKSNRNDYDLGTLAKLIRKDVLDRTSSNQVVEYSELLTNDVYFKTN